MPISSFGEGLQKVLSFVPCTYATSLLRNHSLTSVFEKMEESLPAQIIDGMKGAVDYNLYFFEEQVDVKAMYLIVGVWVVLLLLAYILMNSCKKTA